VVAGAKYRRLFDGTETTQLQFLRTVTTSKGNIVTTYGLKK